ncbi:antitoxin of the YeeV-YeeU toxin-antitoxin system; CP4-44 prophage (fragment) [Enterobacter cancerogenus]
MLWRTTDTGGNRLHYLADRASITGTFSNEDLRHLDQAFPVLMKQLELMLSTGELNPRHSPSVMLFAKGLTCEADTLGSHGYIYIAIFLPHLKHSPKTNSHAARL